MMIFSFFLEIIRQSKLKLSNMSVIKNDKNTSIAARHRKMTWKTRRLICIFYLVQNFALCIFGYSSLKLILIALYFNLDKLLVDRQLSLTHSIWQIRPLFTRSVWNMGEIISIFGLKMMVKSGLERIFLKFLHVQGLFQTS